MVVLPQAAVAAEQEVIDEPVAPTSVSLAAAANLAATNAAKVASMEARCEELNRALQRRKQRQPSCDWRSRAPSRPKAMHFPRHKRLLKQKQSE